MQSNSKQLFECYICYKEAVEPRLCPYCSKIACYQCLLIFLETGNLKCCPHCKSEMNLDQFANCHRFINQVKTAMNTKQNKSSKQKKNKLCAYHEIQLSYYCLTCKKSICSDCIIFSVQHKQHKVQRLSTIYKDKQNKIVEQLAQFDQKITQYQAKVQLIKKDKQRLENIYQNQKQKLKQFFNRLMQKLNKQKEQYQDKINIQMAEVQKDMDMLKNFREGVRKQLEKQSQAYLIHAFDDIVDCIQNFCKQKIQYESQPICFKAIDDIVPKFYTFTTVLEDFLSQQQQYIYSQPHIFNGIQWRTKIYPKGLSDALNTHVSIFVEMRTELPIQKNYVYQIQLINHLNPNKTIFREYQSLFSNGSKWGYNKYIEIYDLSEGFLNDKGQIILNIGIRNSCYADLVQDMSQYLKTIQKIQQQPYQKKKVQNNKKKLQSTSMIVKSERVENQ